MDYFRSSIKVAVLFLISCAVLTYFVLHAGQVRLMGKTQDLILLFSSLGNLKQDSPVTYSGFKVGQVVDIKALSSQERKKYERDVEIQVRISKEVVIRKDSKAQILTLGFLGEKYIELTPGSIDSPALEPGSLILGVVPQDISTVVDHFTQKFDEMLPQLKDTLEKLHSTADHVEKIVGDIDQERKIQVLLEGAKEITGRVNKILDENREPLQHSLENVEALTADMKDQLKIASPKIQDLLDRMGGAVKEMDSILDDVRVLMKKNIPGFGRIMKNLEEASESAKGFLKILKEQPWRLLSKPRATPVYTGPKRGYVIFSTGAHETKKKEHEL